MTKKRRNPGGRGGGYAKEEEDEEEEEVDDDDDESRRRSAPAQVPSDYCWQSREMSVMAAKDGARGRAAGAGGKGTAKADSQLTVHARCLLYAPLPPVRVGGSPACAAG